MSLLMDALKKAELAKRQGQGEGVSGIAGTAGEGGLELELIPNATTTEATAAMPGAEPASAAASLPQLPSHLEDLDAQFMAEAKQAVAARLRAPPPADSVREPSADAAAKAQPRPAAATEARRTPSESSAPRSAAQNLFAAKQAEKPPSRKAFALAIGTFTVLAVCGIAGYFWWQLQPKSALVAHRAPPPPPAATSAPIAVPPAPTIATPPAAPLAAAASPARAPSPDADDKDDDSASGAAKAAPQVRRPSPLAAEPTAPESPIRVTRSPLKVNPALIRGFDAFNRGDLSVAQTEYERARKSDPRNTDALHGLAAIAVRQGRVDEAERLYRQLAETDPHDTVALSALINMRGQTDPGAAESRLKSLAADQPELAAPHFSLGNLYARHGRWNDAQQAYFRAFNAEPDNPDILYNLAISLEHLHQNKLAAQYYAQAIAAAQSRPAGFDKAQAAARLQTLQP